MTTDQKCFAISEVILDWYLLMVSMRNMRSCVVSPNGPEHKRTRNAASRHFVAPIGSRPLPRNPVVGKLPAEDRRLSWPEHTRLTTCSRLIAVAVEWTRWASNPQPVGYCSPKPLRPRGKIRKRNFYGQLRKKQLGLFIYLFIKSYTEYKNCLLYTSDAADE